MPLAFLLDEDFPGPIILAIRAHNRAGIYPIDFVRMGDLPDLPFSSDDKAVLLWAERENRLLVSLDKGTVPKHLKDHLAAGNHSPGVLLVRPMARTARVVEHLVLIAYAGEPDEWKDRIEYIP